MRISLKQTLVTVTLLSVYLGLWLTSTDGILAWSCFYSLAVVTMTAPACAVAGIVYSQGNHRAFWIGAASTTLFGWTFLGLNYGDFRYIGGDELQGLKNGLALLHATTLAGGIAAIIVYRTYHPRGAEL